MGISHWLIDCPFFNHIRSKVNDKILFLYNAFYRGNLTNDIVNSNNDNSNSNISNSNNSNSNNSYSNISNSIFSSDCSNYRSISLINTLEKKRKLILLIGSRTIRITLRLLLVIST